MLVELREIVTGKNGLFSKDFDIEDCVLRTNLNTAFAPI